MPPMLALAIWIVLLLALLVFDPAKEPNVSGVIWIPVIWMAIAGSRLPSVWLGGSTGGSLEEGNSVDRSIYSVLIVVAILVLMTRGFNWPGFVAKNLPLVLFLTYAMISFLWSDFPYVAFKRWFRDLGNYFMVLLVLSDAYPLEALRTLLRRVSYLLIPLSVVLIKYFPEMAKSYGVWNGVAEFTGVTTSKNMLGALCLLSGLYFFWDVVNRWSHRKEGRNKRVLWVDFAFLGMTLWLLSLSNSATSKLCLTLGCMVIYVAHSRWGQRHATLLKVTIPAGVFLYAVLAFGFNFNAQIASQVGRDPTLTDRTLIWSVVLSEKTNPVLGVGYESFWLGPRLERIWPQVGAINETHNGYLDTYLTLGIVGLVLLILFLASAYRRACKYMTTVPELGVLALAVWTILLFYNVTEAAFKGGLLWTTLLCGAIVLPERASEEMSQEQMGVVEHDGWHDSGGEEYAQEEPIEPERVTTIRYR